MVRWLFDRINLWVILGGILVAGGLVALFGLVILLLPVPVKKAASVQSALTIIVAPSPTLSPTPITETPTPTAPPSIGGIAVGNYVQISGTEGEGLRLRSDAGVSSPMRFVGMDEEVFRVKEGPKTADGFVWWYLEAPYDASRSGWAAAKYLKLVNPTPTPTP